MIVSGAGDFAEIGQNLWILPAGVTAPTLLGSMPIWFAAVLGFVQGLTEFLPISSTAHLRIIAELLEQKDSGAAFSAVIQLGTLAAVLVYFRQELFVEMPRALVRDRKSPAARRMWLIGVGTIPIVIFGLCFKDFITGPARSLWVVAAALILVGGVFFIAERRRSGDRTIDMLLYRDAVIIGLAQTCALIPGVSRSGATIVAALFLGMNRSEGARFSFLLGVPAIAGSGLFELKDAVSLLGDDPWMPLLVGISVSAVVGYASIAWLLRFLRRHSLVSFGAYRIGLGILLVVLCATSTIRAQ